MKTSYATSFALECQAQFLLEERTERYLVYRGGVPERKIVPGAKKSAGSRALLVGRLAGAEVVDDQG
jgi:hypothetical protein